MKIGVHNFLTKIIYYYLSY